MTMLDFPELKELDGTLNERRKKLHTIFDEMGPDRDMTKVKSLDGDSAAKVEAIRALNEEIDELAKKAEPLRALAKAAQHAADYDDGSGHIELGGGETPAGEKSIGDLYYESKSRFEKGREFELPDVDVKTTLLTSAGWAPQAVRGPIRWPWSTWKRPRSRTRRWKWRKARRSRRRRSVHRATSSVRKIAVYLPGVGRAARGRPPHEGAPQQPSPVHGPPAARLQILVGDGSPPNLRGILNVSGIQTQAKGADPTPDAVYKAMVLIMTTGQAEPRPRRVQPARLAGRPPAPHRRRHLHLGQPQLDAGPKRIWGLPVVLEQGLTQNTAVVGDFQDFAELDIKKGLTVETGYNNDDWTKNLQTIRAEMRAARVLPARRVLQITGV
jgi:hypothetical protein